jgi:aminoglycoside/choline kinase family phosphotransferase
MYLSLIHSPYSLVQVIREDACYQPHDEDDPMHVEQGMKTKYKQYETAVDKNQNSRCFHMVETYINQQMMDVPAIRFEWRCTPHYPSNEHA